MQITESVSAPAKCWSCGEEVADGQPFCGSCGKVQPPRQADYFGMFGLPPKLDLDVPAPVITTSLFHRYYSRGNGEFGSKVLAAMRNQFGGHAVKKAGAK